MKKLSKSRRNVYSLFAGAILAALPTLAFGQGQIDAGRSNDASNRVGSGGRNQAGVNSTYGNNSYIINNGNQIVTGNVSQGREFHGNVGYTDPSAFRAPTSGSFSENFAKNSTGVPQAHTPEQAPNVSTPFYGAAQTAAPPSGFQLNANRTGFVAAPPPDVRGVQDRRLGVIDLNQPMSAVPQPGEMVTRGSLNPQQAAQELGVLTGSLLYGVREWNPQDPADRAFLENLLNRQSTGLNRNQIDPQDLKKMRNELDPEMQKPAGTQSFDSAGNPAMVNPALADSIKNQPLGSQGLSTQQGTRYNVLGAAHKTSAQYSELNKRLEAYNAERKNAGTENAQKFNADLKARHDAEVKAAALKNKNPNDLATPPKPPVEPVVPEDPTKPKVKKPQPVKVNTLAAGVKGEGLSNVLKKAEGLMKDGKYTSALDQYDIAETVTPNNPLIWLGRANAELGAGFFLRADAHLRQALTTDKALLMGQYDLTGMLGEDRLTKLVNDLKDVANKDTKQSSSLFLLAYVAYNTGHERQALGYLDLAEKRSAEQAPFYKMLKDHWALPDDGAKPELNK